jgi:hypothetical protein
VGERGLLLKLLSNISTYIYLPLHLQSLIHSASASFYPEACAILSSVRTKSVGDGPALVRLRDLLPALDDRAHEPQAAKSIVYDSGSGTAPTALLADALKPVLSEPGCGIVGDDTNTRCPARDVEDRSPWVLSNR